MLRNNSESEAIREFKKNFFFLVGIGTGQSLIRLFLKNGLQSTKLIFIQVLNIYPLTLGIFPAAIQNK